MMFPCSKRYGRCWINQESDANHIRAETNLLHFLDSILLHMTVCGSGHASLGYRLVRMKQSPPCRMAWRNKDIMTACCTDTFNDFMTAPNWRKFVVKFVVKNSILNRKYVNFTHKFRLEDAEALWHPRRVGQGVDLSFELPTREAEVDRGCDRFATKRRRSHPAPRNERVLKKRNVPNPIQVETESSKTFCTFLLKYSTTFKNDHQIWLNMLNIVLCPSSMPSAWILLEDNLPWHHAMLWNSRAAASAHHRRARRARGTLSASAWQGADWHGQKTQGIPPGRQNLPSPRYPTYTDVQKE